MNTPPRGTVAVAYSGGRDSTALLHATAVAARELALDVVALHVHHGLLPQADAWLQRAGRQCARWRRAGLPVRFSATRLQGKPARGDSVEAWARRERYAALARMARAEGASVVLLAHHRRDQAETVLLQALRGAGAAGLAAMPRESVEGGIAWCRPWLEQPHAAIEAYARQHRLRGVDDPSNTDLRYARSRLRTAVWPVLSAAFPEAEAALAAVARRAQWALRLQTAVADADLALLRDGEHLHVAAWRKLDDTRRVNVLQAWLRERLGHAAPGSLIERLARELPAATAAHWPVDAAHALRLHRARLSLAVPRAATPVDAEMAIDLSMPGTHRLPAWGGSFVVRRVRRGGAPVELLRAACLRRRSGGEQFQSHGRGVPRSLKKQYQAAGVPAWDRAGPLVWCGDALVAVPGLGIDARCRCAGAGLSVRWIPAEAGSPRRRS
ncbi:MAG: tRNA lysidine(34) synthetase TilS [Burkholderiaceae bacterium]